MGKIADALRDSALPQHKRAQIIALDQEFVDMEAKVKILEAENLKLQAKVNPLEREIERLKNQAEKKSASVHSLESDEIEMLKFIGNQKTCNSSDIAKGMNMHSVPVEHYVGRLLKNHYLVQQHVPMLGAMYSLSDVGNAYLVDNKLVPLKTGETKGERPDNPKGHRCDHCGSVQLRRIGNRPDPTFGSVGIKQALYRCLSCTRQSAFTNDE